MPRDGSTTSRNGAAAGRHLRWRHLLPASAILLGLAIPAQVTFDGDDFLAVMTFMMMLVPLGVLVEVAFLVALVFTRGPVRRMVALSAVCLPLAGVAMYLRGALEPADRVRWALHGDDYKRQVSDLEQGARPAGPPELASVAWKEAGWGGINFFYYLVHDPSDRLGETWRRSKDGRVAGVPCPANDATRLEAGWYIVLFNLPWGDCGP